MWVFSSCDEWASDCDGFSSEHGLYSTSSVIVVKELGCPVACGIFLDQGLNPSESIALAGEFLTT